METESDKCCQSDSLSTKSEDSDSPRKEELNKNNTSRNSEMNGNRFNMVLIKEEPHSDPDSEPEASPTVKNEEEFKVETIKVKCDVEVSAETSYENNLDNVKKEECSLQELVEIVMTEGEFNLEAIKVKSGVEVSAETSYDNNLDNVKKEECPLQELVEIVMTEGETATGSQLPTLREHCTLSCGKSTTDKDVRTENNTSNGQEKLSGEHGTDCDKYLKDNSKLIESDKSLCTTEETKNSSTNLNNLNTSKVGTVSASSDRPYQCDTCKKSFKDRKILRVHVRIHTNIRPYSCDVCNKSYAKLYNLTVHYRSHTGERPYPCEFCRKSFARSVTLQKHIRTHTGERPYSCDYCSKAFSCLSNLKQHSLIHTGERPYSCDTCKVDFTQLNHLKHHRRTRRCLRANNK